VTALFFFHLERQKKSHFFYAYLKAVLVNHYISQVKPWGKNFYREKIQENLLTSNSAQNDFFGKKDPIFKGEKSNQISKLFLKSKNP